MSSPQPDGQSPLDPDRVASIGLLLSKLGTAVDRRLAAALEVVQLRPKHLGALSVLGGHGAVSQQALGERLGVDASAVVAIVDDLEREGLARRERDPRDRRRHAIQVTPAGERVLARGYDAAGEVDDTMLADLTAHEREQLLTLLLRVAGTDPGLDRLIRAGAIATPAR
ncbi:MAG: winged helix-turn-helix transcriptional regulator [Actinobacteria bacterium]|nr:winged helix-turn-helix transcriptional regulator [Actinomycetota bacterium]